MQDDILDMQGMEKAFNGIPVLKKARFELRRGEIHALMGGNGAGKSTLMKILTGVYLRDAGTLTLDGKAETFATPAEAEGAGVAMIFQELSLVPTLTVAQNIFLHREPRRGAFVDDREACRQAQAILDDLGEAIDPRMPVELLSTGARQMVEIAKALSKKARVLIMDEPTSSLSDTETQSLFRIARRLKERGVAIVYISHRMSEIFEICDRVTVMRDGATVLTDDCANVSMERLIEAMLGGGSVGSLQWRERPPLADVGAVLEVRNLGVAVRVHDVSFSIRAGEIVGLAGLMGSGRTEIAEAIFGVRAATGGEIRIEGKPVRSTDEAMAAGVALVPEDRRRQGLVLDHSVQSNFALPSLKRFSKGLFVRDRAAANEARQSIRDLKIRTDGPAKVVQLLSGGNQQKVVLAKWLARHPKLLILDEPTVGVDIGAKTDIVEIVREIADRGTAVLVISSEFEELLALSDRLVVLHDGRVVKTLERRDIASEEVLHHAVQG
ncbi:sugar ABC transporter ATP-binding protein [Aureimonas sp. AU40]|uniref:sugar ABC transporter ATP-binding protein n=1 Tax=Aureimonas sp. AU40 TaxID=1637747 RepID=UPI00078173CD|nr:sugar ABC transporter ATP-binding protein [Aureimonas sp. AU40]